jgi:hypothetical protein
MSVIVILCAFSQISACILSQARADEFTGDPLLLKLIATQNEQNVRAIDCWQGTVEIIERRSQLKEGIKTASRRDVHFAWNRQMQAWRWSNEWLEFSATQGKKELPNEWDRDGGMIKENAYYRLSPYLQSTRNRKTFVIFPIENYSRGYESPEFDPMYYFSDHGEPAYKRFGGLYSLVKIGGARSWTVGRVGDMVTVSSTTQNDDGTGVILNLYEVDMSKGANIVRCFNSNSSLSVEVITDYEKNLGLWVPVHGVYERIVRDGTDRSRREMKWKASQVNHAMEKTAIVDKRDGSESTFGQGN